MMTAKRFLESVYQIETAEDTQALYRDWSESYDAEVEANGYATPRRCAEALASAVPSQAGPVLDIGCGTGLSGVALRLAGFEAVDGIDFSAEMLAEAKKKGVYRETRQVDVSDPLPFAPGDYPCVAAVGLFSPAHAGANVIDDVLAKLPPEGFFVFSLNDHALEDPSYVGRIRENVDTGWARTVFWEYGEHLPKIGLRSEVYVLQRL